MSQSNSDIRTQIVQKATNLIGSPYSYGAKGPKSFDCSGFVHYVLRDFDIYVSGSAQSISRQGSEVDRNSAQPGDLIFFKKGGRIFHVSIISQINNGQIQVIHSTTSRGVILENVVLSSYWKEKIDKILSLDSLK